MRKRNFIEYLYKLTFSFTINDIQTQAQYVWAYDRCEIVRTYHARPALFPPFTFLISMVRCVQWCWRKVCKKRSANRKIHDEDSTYFSKSIKSLLKLIMIFRNDSPQRTH